MNKIRALGVVGGGQLGSGIAQVAASAGIEVTLVDTSSHQLERALSSVKQSLEKLHSKGKLSEDPGSIASRLSTGTDIDALHRVDFAVEAVPEDEALKTSVLQHLDRCTPSHAILASNTSSISITRLGAATRRPHAVIGMHFMNPVPLMQLVECIKGLATSEDTYQTTIELAHELGKQTCTSADRPGFIVNRVLMPMINEAFYALMEGVGSAEDIDIGMKLGTNQPMGPLRLADYIGLDTCLAILRVLHRHLGDDKYRACPLLAQHVDAGWLGKKTGRGVYAYSEGTD